MEAVRIPFTTDAAGDAVVYSGRMSGALYGVYIDHGSGASELAATVDITVTDDSTGASLLALSNVAGSARYLVLNQAVDAAGSPVADVYSGPPVVGTVKVVAAQGGNTKSGAVVVYLDGSVSEAVAFATRTLS